MEDTWQILSTFIIRVNKAQNAQIQVNSHIIFTEYRHYLHDFGENTYITQHKQIDCTTVEFSQTASARPISASSLRLTKVYQSVGCY